MKISNTLITGSAISILGILSTIPAQAVTLYQSSVNTANGTIPSLTGSPATTRNNFTTAASALPGTAVNLDFGNLTNANFTQGTGNSYTATVNGVTISISNLASAFTPTSNSSANNGISQFSGNQAYGFNTTSSNGAVLRLDPTTGTTVTYTFAQAVSSFGTYITDYGNTGTSGGSLSATATTVNSTNFSLGNVNRSVTTSTPTSSTRAVLFYGFVNAANDPLVSSVTFTFAGIGGNTDRLSLDGVAYTQAVPEPLTMAGAGLAAGLGYLMKRKISSAKKV